MSDPFLKAVMPELADELKTLLENDNHAELAGQISSLRIVDRCRCDEDDCATFYTVPKPDEAWGLGHESILLDPREGWLVLDVLNGKIVCVEILNRSDLHKELLRHRP